MFIFFGNILIDLILELDNVSKILSLEVTNMFFEPVSRHGLIASITLNSHNFTVFLDMIEAVFNCVKFLTTIWANHPLLWALGCHVVHKINYLVSFKVSWIIATMLHLLFLQLLQHQLTWEIFDLKFFSLTLRLRTLSVALVKDLIVAFSTNNRLARQAFSQIQWSSFAIDAFQTLDQSHERFRPSHIIVLEVLLPAWEHISLHMLLTDL